MFVTSGRRNERGAHLEERRTMVVGLRGRTSKARIRRERGPAPAIAVLLAVAAGSVFPTPGSAQIPQQGVFDLEKGDISVALDRTAYLAGEPAELAVRLVIEDGWHANSNQPTYDYLIATAVDLELPPDWPPARAVGYSPGEMKTFSFAPTAISVYEGEVFVRASVPTPAGASPGTYPIRANVTYQACDDKMCLAPVTTPATVGLTVGTGGQAANPEFFAADAGDGTGRRRASGGLGTGVPLVRAPRFRGRPDPQRHAVRPSHPVAEGVRAREECGGRAAGRHGGRPRHGGRDHPLVPVARGGGDRGALSGCRRGLGQSSSRNRSSSALSPW